MRLLCLELGADAAWGLVALFDGAGLATVRLLCFELGADAAWGLAALFDGAGLATVRLLCLELGADAAWGLAAPLDGDEEALPNCSSSDSRSSPKNTRLFDSCDLGRLSPNRANNWKHSSVASLYKRPFS